VGKTVGRCPTPYPLFEKNKALLPTAKASLRLADQFVGALLEQKLLCIGKLRFPMSLI
jgi:hypothetical protein